jgi:hypothetical protein
LNSARTIFISTFVNGDMVLFFPVVKGVMAVRAEQLRACLVFLLMPFMDFECGLADLTYQLRTSYAIIKIDEMMGSLAERTGDDLRHGQIT